MVSKDWAVVLTHVSNISSLAALIPIIGELRLGSHRRSLEAAKEKKGNTDDESPPVAMGVPSVLFFMCAEVSRCWKLFDPSAKQIENLVKKVKETIDKPGHPNSQLTGKLVPILNELFAADDVRTAIHSLVLLILLSSILVSLIIRTAKRSSMTRIAQWVVKVLVIAGFVWSQQDVTLKVWKQVVETGLAAALYFPLMALGVVFSNPVSTGFGCAQLIFWVARFSLVFQSTVPQFRKFLLNPSFLMESPEMGVMLINIIVMGWLLVGHLPQVESGFVVLGLLVAMSFMPPLLVNCWEPALKMMGWNVKILAAGTQVLHLSVIGMLFLIGGTVNILCLTGMFNILLRIHGQDALGLQLG